MKKFENALDQLQIQYDEAMIGKFEKYMELVLSWNEKVNLTAITDRDEFIEKHFIDSILCAGCPEIEGAERIIDVGTGAGFPGIPLALIYPQKEFLLMDSLNKKIRILDEIFPILGLENVQTLHGRAEEIAVKREYREGYDLCVSRAVANLATLCEYCLPFIRKGGFFIAYKGIKSTEEMKEAAKAISILGGKINEERQPIVEEFKQNHRLIIIEKIKATPMKYPRKAGIPSKEPLK